MQKSLHTLWNIWLHNPTIVKLSVGLGVIVSASSIYIYIYMRWVQVISGVTL